MRVHFICRGNAFRSRIAEAYLRSLQLPNVEVLSSGTVATANAVINGDMPSYTRHALQKYGILDYAKSFCEDLTAKRISDDDITIVMGATAFSEMQAAGLTPVRAEVWDVPDTGELFEGSRMPERTSPRVNEFAEQNYQRIAELIDTKLLIELR